MASYSRKLYLFLETIKTDAKAEVNGIHKEIEERREQFLQSAETELLNEMYAYIRQKSGEARAEAGRRISAKTLANKKALYLYRQSIENQVMADVKQRVKEYTTTQEYQQDLIKMAAYAAAVLGVDNLEIYIRAEDLKHADLLKAQVPAAYSSGDIRLGGLIAKKNSDSLLLDLTYDASFAEVSGTFGEISDFGN